MTVSKSTAKERYGRGIKGIGGASTYKECGKEKDKGFLAVAKCLEDASKAKLTTRSMIERYGKAA